AAEGGPQVAAFLEALADNAVKYTDTQVFLVDGAAAKDPVTGAVLTLPEDAEDVVNNNYMRSAIGAARAALRLGSADPAERLAAARALSGEPDASRVALIEQALARESDDRVKAQLALVRAASLLGSDDP